MLFPLRLLNSEQAPEVQYLPLSPSLTPNSEFKEGPPLDLFSRISIRV
jgi:hypothetical protein